MVRRRKKVLFEGNDEVHEGGLELLRQHPDIAVEVIPLCSISAARSAAEETYGILVRDLKIDAQLIDDMPNLAVISRLGVGFDKVDVAALTRRGIPLTIVGDVLAPTVAEHALYLMLALAKQGLASDSQARQGDFTSRQSCTLTELWRKTALIIGFGRIGRRVAQLCAAFGMTVHVFDPYVPEDLLEECGFSGVTDLKAALGRADYVSLHAPLNADTRSMMGPSELQAMKADAFLINVSRGELIDEAALQLALTSGHIRGAGIDTFTDEPPRPDNALLKLENVVLSPHNASMTAECMARMAMVAAQNIIDAFSGSLNENLVVNSEVLDLR